MEEYRTDSLNLSSYLVAEGCELNGVERITPNSNKFVFIFPRTSSLEALVNDYFSLRSTVNPQKYYNALRNLRQIIYSKRDSEELQ